MIKFPCHHCGVNNLAEDSDAGAVLICGHCNANILVPLPVAKKALPLPPVALKVQKPADRVPLTRTTEEWLEADSIFTTWAASAMAVQGKLPMKRDLRLSALEYLWSNGIPRTKGDSNDHLDGRARIDLAIDAMVSLRHAVRRIKESNDRDLLDVWPGVTFREPSPREYRGDLLERWAKLGGAFGPDGSIIALKNDPRLVRLSIWKIPMAPFDFATGYSDSDLEISKCISLGLLRHGEQIGKVRCPKAPIVGLLGPHIEAALAGD